MASRVERAKQFLPFDALEGFKEALKEKEKQYEEKRELSEERLNELQNIFNKIEKESKIKIKYYKDSRYIERAGKITNIDYIKKKIQINKNEYINICDIINMEEA